MTALIYSNENVNRFWLHDLSDIALLLNTKISPVEKEDVKQSKELVKRLNDLLLRANQNPTADQTMQINKEAFVAAQDLRRFLLFISKKYLTQIYYFDTQPIGMSLYVDHTEKYMDTLYTFMQNKQPKYDLIQEEIFWLFIFTQTADLFARNVGYFQKKTIDDLTNITERLNEYWAFSVELQGYTRIGKETFPIALDHHIAVVELMREFYELLTNLIYLKQNARIPGSLSLLNLDRTRRMACWFLSLAAQYASTALPDCDPFSERLSIS